jgi:hypothetical protein
MIQPPKSFMQELSAWNDGNGIDLESWIGCMGNFNLATGYSAIFWPNFVLFEDYILREGFDAESLRRCEKTGNRDKSSIEWVINHLHITDIHYNDRENASEEVIVFLGNILKEVYETKLRAQFPDRPCEVEFYEPEDRKNLVEYQLSFWQKKHATKN